MSIALRDVKMPKGCFDPCPCLKDDAYIKHDWCYGPVSELKHDYYCGATGTRMQDHEVGRLANCPAFEFKRWENT